MKIIADSSENEMISEFLKAEINGRFRNKILKALKKHGISRKIIDDPDLKNGKENDFRKTILKEYRGYRENKELFGNFPEKIKWKKALFSRKDLEKIKYIDYSYWNEISGGSRLAKDAVKTIKKGRKIFGVSNKQFFEAAKTLSKQKKFPLLILVSKNKNSRIVVLEGHLRLTAYMLKPELIQDKTEAIIGYSPDFIKWNEY
jgi:hypothetical protein